MECHSVYPTYDESGNSWYFINGRLVLTLDEHRNAYLFVWNEQNQISYIAQINKEYGAITVAEFTYSGDFVSSITDAAGNVYGLYYTEDRLGIVSMNGKFKCFYAYLDKANRICTITDAETLYRIEFGVLYGRTSSYREVVEEEVGQTVNITYPNYSKTLYRSAGNNNVIGDGDDLLTAYLFDDAGRTVNAYVTDVNKKILGATNAVYTDTQSSGVSVDKTANRTEKIGNLGVAAPTLINNGESEWEGWKFISHGAYDDMAHFSSEEKRTGTVSLKITPVMGTQYMYAENEIGVLHMGQTYTASAYVNTSACTEADLNGVFLSVSDDEYNLHMGKGVNYITSEEIDDGWVRMSLTFQALSNTTHYISIGSEKTFGDIYVDDIQLVEGDTAGVYNILRNGDFEFGTGDWTSQTAGTMSIVSGGINTAPASGTSSGNILKINGNPAAASGVYQEVAINQPSEETYVLSGWAKANSVPDNLDTAKDAAQDSKKQFGLRAVITYKGIEEKEYHYTPFCADLSEWQFTTLTIVPKKTGQIVESIKVVCVYEGNANAAYFDNLCLSLEPAQTMKYDEEGNLQSVNTPGLKEDVNTYEGGNLIKSVTGGNGTYTYTYDENNKNRLTSVTDGVVTQDLSYDRFGNVIGTTLKSNNAGNLLRISTTADYSSDGNRMTGLTDATGNHISYAYEDLSSQMYGLPTTVTDGRGNSTQTAYDSEGRMTAVSVPEQIGIAYTYEKGLLKSIERAALGEENETAGQTQQYRFTYDVFGRTTAVYIGDRLLVTYHYYDKYGALKRLEYANGAWVDYSYDILGRVTKSSYSDGRSVSYFYDCNGNLTSIKDSVNGDIYYTYDRLGRLINFEQKETGVQIKYIYDVNNRLTDVKYNIEGWEDSSEGYIYNSISTDSISDGTLTNVELITSQYISRRYDKLQRLIQRTLPGGMTESYTYAAGESQNTTSTQVSGMTNKLGETVKNDFQYTYDENGNILTITDTVTGETITYTYDALNQLTGAAYSTGRTESYSYDAGGNLQSFHNGTTSHTYTYGDEDWKDLLMAVDGVAITYDEVGNPRGYYNGSRYFFSWTAGRKLATITKDGQKFAFQYDADGIRTKKINPDGSYISYINAGGITLGEKHYNAYGRLTKQLRYIYDENGSVCGYSISGDGASWIDYHYIKNLQGDVLQVYRVSDGAIVASYTYDSWGNVLSATGEKVQENPFLYRGYYYDGETGFYYVSSRYYDPEIGRWINADALVDQSSILGYNLFAYCRNNPVNMTDTTGNLPFFVITAGIGALAGAVVGGVVATKNGGNVWACIGIGAAVGGLAGAGLGAVVGVMLAGSATASPAVVASGAGMLATAVSTCGAGAGLALVADNISRAANNVGTVLYSGGEQARQAATTFANNTGGATIDSTVIGKVADAATKVPGVDIATVWSKASVAFCNQASGVVNAFVSNSAYRGVDSIFWSVEMPTLLNNPRVTEIIIHIFE